MYGASPAEPKVARPAVGPPKAPPKARPYRVRIKPLEMLRSIPEAQDAADAADVPDDPEPLADLFVPDKARA